GTPGRHGHVVRARLGSSKGSSPQSLCRHAEASVSGAAGQATGGRDFRPDSCTRSRSRLVVTQAPRPGGRGAFLMEAVFIAAALVFVAELGDKSQLMAMTFA